MHLRPDNTDLEKLLLNKYGQRGLDVLIDFATTSHQHVQHGGAPRSAFLAEYFVRCALNHPGSEKGYDYLALQAEYYDAKIREAKYWDEDLCVLPEIEELDEIMQPKLDELDWSLANTA